MSSGGWQKHFVIPLLGSSRFWQLSSGDFCHGSCVFHPSLGGYRIGDESWQNGICQLFSSPYLWFSMLALIDNGDDLLLIDLTVNKPELVTCATLFSFFNGMLILGLAAFSLRWKKMTVQILCLHQNCILVLAVRQEKQTKNPTTQPFACETSVISGGEGFLRTGPVPVSPPWEVTVGAAPFPEHGAVPWYYGVLCHWGRGGITAHIACSRGI